MTWIGGWNWCNQLIQVALCMWSIHLDDWFLGSTKLMFMQDTCRHEKRCSCDGDIMWHWFDSILMLFWMMTTRRRQFHVAERNRAVLCSPTSSNSGDSRPRQTKNQNDAIYLYSSTSTQLWSYERLLEISSDDFRACFAVFSSAGRPLQIRSNPCWKSSVVHLRSRWAVVVVTLEKSGKNPRNFHLLKPKSVNNGGWQDRDFFRAKHTHDTAEGILERNMFVCLQCFFWGSGLNVMVCFRIWWFAIRLERFCLVWWTVVSTRNVTTTPCAICLSLR